MSMSVESSQAPLPVHTICRLEFLKNLQQARKRKALSSMAPKEEEQAEVQDLQQKQFTKKAKRSNSDASVNIRKELESKPLPPDPKIDTKPIVFLQELTEAMTGFRPEVKSALKMDGYFPKVTEEQIAAYDMKVTTAARNNDLPLLKELYREGRSMDCCNRFGESLLHMACRRGFVGLGEFLLNDVKLSVRICDDLGRNPFHDICWNPTIEVDLAVLLLKRDPSLLFIGDKRGHTPFDYARPQDWPKWRAFLYEHRELLQPIGGDSAMQKLFSAGEVTQT
jgi:hypothetical protein